MRESWARRSVSSTSSFLTHQQLPKEYALTPPNMHMISSKMNWKTPKIEVMHLISARNRRPFMITCRTVMRWEGWSNFVSNAKTTDALNSSKKTMGTIKGSGLHTMDWLSSDSTLKKKDVENLLVWWGWISKYMDKGASNADNGAVGLSLSQTCSTWQGFMASSSRMFCMKIKNQRLCWSFWDTRNMDQLPTAKVEEKISVWREESWNIKPIYVKHAAKVFVLAFIAQNPTIPMPMKNKKKYRRGV